MKKRRRATRVASSGHWLTLASQIWLLGMEAQQVIGLRMLKVGAGGVAAGDEIDLMVREKMAASAEVQGKAIMAMAGGYARAIPARTLAIYRRKVRENRRRLSSE